MDETQRNFQEKRLQELQRELDDLRARWPAHSVKPAMLNQLEDLEEEIENLKELLNESRL